jgi:hypothetical protein
MFYVYKTINMYDPSFFPLLWLLFFAVMSSLQINYLDNIYLLLMQINLN